MTGSPELIELFATYTAGPDSIGAHLLDLNLLADWAPAAEDRTAILVEGPTRLFFS